MTKHQLKAKWLRRRNRILRLKQSGLSYVAIAKIDGVHPRALHSVLARGIAKATRCDKCNSTEQPIDNHHISYVPEVIQTLCRKCHQELHKEGNATRQSRKALKIRINGESRTVREWSAKTGIPKKTLRERIKRGTPENKLLVSAYGFFRHEHTITVDGVVETVSFFAKKSGIPMRTLWARIKAGVPPDVAVKTPLQKTGRKLPR